jgi:hypothetical protein
MERGPSPGVIRNPVPTLPDVPPMAASKGPPMGINTLGSPYPTMLGHPNPVSIRSQFVVEIFHVDFRFRSAEFFRLITFNPSRILRVKICVLSMKVRRTQYGEYSEHNDLSLSHGYLLSIRRQAIGQAKCVPFRQKATSNSFPYSF